MPLLQGLRALFCFVFPEIWSKGQTKQLVHQGFCTHLLDCLSGRLSSVQPKFMISLWKQLNLTEAWELSAFGSNRRVSDLVWGSTGLCWLFSQAQTSHSVLASSHTSILFFRHESAQVSYSVCLNLGRFFLYLLGKFTESLCCSPLLTCFSF